MKSTAIERSNSSRYVWAHGLQNVGDQIIAAKTVLPWLLQVAGTPGFFIALLVPIRESGSMLPQAALTPWVKTRRRRVSVWIVGALGQALAGFAIAISALLLSGTVLGIAVLAALAIFALSRALCSMASKDVQGRIIAKGNRGRISGRATMLGGVASVLVGVLMWVLTDRLTNGVVAGLIAAASCTWLVAIGIFRGVKEPLPDDTDGRPNSAWWRDTWALFTRDHDFRIFVIVRSLLLVTALSTSFIVTLSSVEDSNIGVFLIVGGVASLIGGRITGMWSDRSSKNVLTASALAGSLVLLILVASATWLPPAANAIILPLGFFVMNIVHASVRVARSTYVVDMAEGDKRTEYVASSNTLMGVILLIVGAISGVIASWGPAAALLFLSALGLVGVGMSTKLKDVSIAEA